MTVHLQNGIYYQREPHLGNSFCILFLKASDDADAVNIGNKLASLWLRLKELEKGIVKDLDINPKSRSSGNLSILLGYGRRIFLIDGVARSKPADFDDKWTFEEPDPKGGGAIIKDSEIYYSDDLNHNHAIHDHILIQFIANTEFYTTRALVETWKELQSNKKSADKTSLQISAYYTGFQSTDGRGLLGFHDGVSNLKSPDRLDTIAIKSNHLDRDRWTINGTYLAFIRIIIDLKDWDDLSVEKQEILIGRDKETGCPLIGVDEDGRPVKDGRCPVPGNT